MNGITYGRVVSTSPKLMIQIPGSFEPVHITNLVDGYIPSPDDRVFLIELAEGQWLVAGKYTRSEDRD